MTPNSRPQVSVIIPTYRRYGPLLNTLAAVLSQRCADFEVIVVDQNHAWPTDLLDRKAQVIGDRRLKWVAAKPGVVSARHDAVEIASGDIFVFIDDDVEIPDPYFLARHMANYDAMPELDAVVGREVYPEQRRPPIYPFPQPGHELVRGRPFEGSPLDQVLRFDRMSSERFEVTSFCTCNSSIRRKSFLRVCGFDESFYGSAYGDDYDLAIRLSKAGGIIVYDPCAWLIHLKSPAGGLRLSDQSVAISEKDRIFPSVLFMMKNWRRPWRGYLFWKVLRRSILLKANISRPWRQPAVWRALWQAWHEARRTVRGGHRSRFNSRT